MLSPARSDGGALGEQPRRVEVIDTCAFVAVMRALASCRRALARARRAKGWPRGRRLLLALAAPGKPVRHATVVAALAQLDARYVGKWHRVRHMLRAVMRALRLGGRYDGATRELALFGRRGPVRAVVQQTDTHAWTVVARRGQWWMCDGMVVRATSAPTLTHMRLALLLVRW